MGVTESDVFAVSTAVVSVPEISCAACKTAIEGALNPLNGVRAAAVDIAAKRVTVSASPQTLSSTGGTSEITARVETEAGTALPGAPVTFTTSAGSVNPTTATTDASGLARTTLTAATQADVTATSGAT